MTLGKVYLTTLIMTIFPIVEYLRAFIGGGVESMLMKVNNMGFGSCAQH